MFAKFSTLMVMFLSAVSMALASDDVVVRSESNNAHIENNVSASSSAGGQKSDGGGTIRTGSAHSESSVQTNISSGGGQAEVKAQAEVNGKKIEVKSEGKGSSVIEKSASDENGEAKIYVKTDVSDTGDDNAADEQDASDRESVGEEISDGTPEMTADDPGETMAEDQSNFIENIINKIVAWLF